MKAENCDVVGDKCVKNDKGELALTDAEKHLAWKDSLMESFYGIKKIWS